VAARRALSSAPLMRWIFLFLAILLAMCSAVWALFTMPGATGSEDGLIYTTGSVGAAWSVALLPLAVSVVILVWSWRSLKKH
jgi:hypothetical protein